MQKQQQEPRNRGLGNLVAALPEYPVAWGSLAELFLLFWYSEHLDPGHFLFCQLALGDRSTVLLFTPGLEKQKCSFSP